MEAALEDTGGGAGTYGGGDGDLSAVVDDVGFGGKLGVEVLVAAVDIGDESMPLLDAEDSLNVLLIPMLPKLESLMTWLTGATLQGKSKILNRGNTRSGTSCFCHILGSYQMWFGQKLLKNAKNNSKIVKFW